MLLRGFIFGDLLREVKVRREICRGRRLPKREEDVSVCVKFGSEFWRIMEILVFAIIPEMLRFVIWEMIFESLNH